MTIDESKKKVPDLRSGTCVFVVLAVELLVEFVANAEGKGPAEVVHAACRKYELILGTDVERELEGEVGKVGLETQLTSQSQTNTVVDAVAHLNTGTGKPTQPSVISPFHW